MKWRPRLSIPLGKGFRINIGRRGIGASAGIPGVARFGVGSDGRTRTSVGKGLLRWEHQGSGKKQPGGCGCSGCLTLLILGCVVAAGIGFLLPQKQPVTGSTSASSKLTAGAVTAPRIPLFRNPVQAAGVPLSMGLKDTAEGKPAWRAGELGWYSLSTLVTHVGKLSKVGDVDNSIDCYHESNGGSQVERVTWTAKVFNPEGQAATLPRFKELCLKYASQLGCPLPAGLFENVDPAKGQRLETVDATFDIEKLTYDQGFGWRFRVTAK
jgi:hypothetical protein